MRVKTANAGGRKKLNLAFLDETGKMLK